MARQEKRDKKSLKGLRDPSEIRHHTNNCDDRYGFITLTTQTIDQPAVFKTGRHDLKTLREFLGVKRAYPCIGLIITAINSACTNVQQQDRVSPKTGANYKNQKRHHMPRAVFDVPLLHHKITK